MSLVEPWTVTAEASLPYAKFELRDSLWPADFAARRVSADPILALITGYTGTAHDGGTVRFELDGRVSAAAHPGEIFLTPPGLPVHVRGAQQSASARSLLCTFDRSRFVAKSGLNDWDWGRLDTCLNMRSRPIASTMRRVQSELLQPDFASKAIVEALAETLVFDIARVFGAERAGKPRRGSLAPWQLRRIDDALRTAGTKWPGREELATLCGISPRYLAEAFQRTTGQNLSDHIRSVRVDLAKDLLSGNRTGVKQVAFDLGFPSLTSFSLAFTRAVGISPSRFARLMRSGSNPDLVER